VSNIRNYLSLTSTKTIDLKIRNSTLTTKNPQSEKLIGDTKKMKNTNKNATFHKQQYRLH